MPGQKKALNSAEIYVAAAVLIVAALLIIPIPARLLDIFLALNLIFALAILLMALRAKKKGYTPLFPTMVLVSTVFGLALNISAARLILIMGTNFNGFLIRSTSELAGGFQSTDSNRIHFYFSLAVYLLIAAGNLFFVAKGAVRIAEVAVRFALDSLPGKQMAIDEAFSSGRISMEEAEAGKKKMLDESDFLLALEGGSKFVFGGAKAGIIITASIIIGGTLIDHFYRGNTITNALETHAFLAIGCGLHFMIQVLLISIAIGIIATGKKAG